ncbi:hypothetical protein AVEN_51112-1 [Araneus ventricosus]|uniref:Uncharacterized protein n=1 Tax=Araneus ventricosus TaxID=182803 RepID=A0A4Y2KL42_ARAVE|nr:hypothetical protein AVEN_51112-1 [Araneus ventricosus]
MFLRAVRLGQSFTLVIEEHILRERTVMFKICWSSYSAVRLRNVHLSESTGMHLVASRYRCSHTIIAKRGVLLKGFNGTNIEKPLILISWYMWKLEDSTQIHR